MSRGFRMSFCVLLLLLLAVTPSFAGFPDGKPIRIVNPFAAGGAGTSSCECWLRCWSSISGYPSLWKI